MSTDEREEQASLYVLGLLAPEEERAFESEMASDRELSTLVADLEHGAAGLAAIVEPRTPPPALRERIVGSIRRNEKEPSNIISMFRFGNFLPWALAASLALVAGWASYQQYHLHLLVDSYTYRDNRTQVQIVGLQNESDALKAQLAQEIANRSAASQQVATLQARIADLQGRDALSQIRIAHLESLAKNAPKAMAIVAWDERAQQGILQTSNMPAARADQSYQLWIIDPEYKTPVSAGIFNPASREDFQPTHPIQKADKFAISLEKKGGSDTTPKGPIVLVGE